MKVFVLLAGLTLIGLAAASSLSMVQAPVDPRTLPYSGARSNPAPRRRCSTNGTHYRAFSKNGLINERYRWTDFNVYPDPAYSEDDRNRINEAMWTLSNALPCINFGIWPKGSNPTGDYVKIIKGSNNGCDSAVGKIGGMQEMNLETPGCMHVGVIMHEMIHALGFEHEQCRPDRDDFINIFWENIERGMEYNFDKESTNRVSTFGVEYNYKSIMHYDSYAFSVNGRPTMLTKSGGLIEDPLELAESDKTKLNKMYKC